NCYYCMKKLFLILFLILFSGMVFAGDLALEDISATSIQRGESTLITATVYNSNAGDVSVTVSFAIYDSSGNMIGTTEEEISNLEKGERGEITHSLQVPDVADYLPGTYKASAEITNGTPENDYISNDVKQTFFGVYSNQEMNIPEMPLWFIPIILVIALIIVRKR
ncbi:MAG: FxLYD domain-containing protein, partial [archaeon]